MGKRRSRPNARGVPFFMLRLDHAGNVSKRFSSGTFPFSKFGGTCPLWNVHATFDTPGRMVTQVIELPDGSRYFSMAQTVRRTAVPHGTPNPRFAIGLGCELKYAPRLIYSAGINLDGIDPTPIGVNCRLCERAAFQEHVIFTYGSSPAEWYMYERKGGAAES